MPSTEHPLTILLVDDDPTLLDVLSRVLKRDGHNVVKGNGVAEALEMAERQTPDVALVDLSLPDGDGVALADRLRERHPDLPLILMTAYPIRIREDPDIASRFKRVMIKPLDLEELRQAVRESLHGARAPDTAIPSMPSLAAAPAPAPAVSGESGAVPSLSTPRFPDRWRGLRSGAILALALVVLVGFFIYISGVPIPGLSPGPEATASPPAPLGVDLAPDMLHTLVVPDEVKKALGIRKGDKDETAIAVAPTEGRPLVLTGSTALDPNEVLHVRVRFAPAKIVEVGPANQDPNLHEKGVPPTKVLRRELRVGDNVHEGDLLGVFFSDAVGAQKNALFDAESQRRLDQSILSDARASAAAVKTFVDNAERNVEADANRANQAANTLRTWGIPEADIQKIIDEAKTSRGGDVHIGKEKYDEWGRVELRADMDGVIVERGIPQNELVQDATTSLFQIAKVDHMQVIADASEDDLKTLLDRRRSGRPLRWSIQTVNGPEKNPSTGKDQLFPIDDIGYIVDPSQHSALVKGYIPNPEGKMRGAQIVTATIPLDPPDGVVEVDVHALADDGSGRTFVFVQTDEKKSLYTLRRVQVTQRFDKYIYVQSKLDSAIEGLAPNEKEQNLSPLEPLHEGDKVLTSGVLELKKELEDRESETAK